MYFGAKGAVYVYVYINLLTSRGCRERRSKNTNEEKKGTKKKESVEKRR